MKLYVDGELVGEGKASGLITKDPGQGLEIGLDGQTAVGEYNITTAIHRCDRRSPSVFPGRR